MIPSNISSSHHYYSFLYKPNEGDLNAIINQFEYRIEINSLFKLYHCQTKFKKRLGDDNVLSDNKVKINNETYYYYDFYVGQVEINDEILFLISYPYKGLENFIYNEIITDQENLKFYIPNLNLLLEVLKTKGFFNLESNEIGIVAEVIKYSAMALNDDNTDRVNLIGINPQDSMIYKSLNEQFQLHPLSIKLKYSIEDENDSINILEVIIDKIGNLRSWIPKGKQNRSVEAILNCYLHLHSINALNIAHRLSKYQAFEE